MLVASGILLVIGVLGLIGVVALVAFGARRQVVALERGVAAGDATGLAELTPGSLASLSKDVVGGAYHEAAPSGGGRVCKVALTVPACEGPHTLLAVSAQSSARRDQGRIDVLACGPKMALVLEQGIWQVQVDGQAFGAIDPATGELDDVERGSVGFYRRTAQGVHVRVEGGDVAWIDSDAKLHRRKPDSLRPLLRLASPSPDPDAALWTLAIVALELVSAVLPDTR